MNGSDDDLVFPFLYKTRSTHYKVTPIIFPTSQLFFSAEKCNEVLSLDEPVKSHCSSFRLLNRLQRGKMLGFILRRRVRQHHFAWISHHCIRACSLWAAPVCSSWCKPSGSLLAALKKKNGNAQTYSRNLAYCSLSLGASETRFYIVHEANAIASLWDLVKRVFNSVNNSDNANNVFAFQNVRQGFLV